MSTNKSELQLFLEADAGQDLIEYALVAALLSLATIAALRSVATSVSSTYSSISSSIASLGS